MTVIVRFVAVLLVAFLVVAQVSADNQQSVRPKIDVCFVLDTTGSMSGMLSSAKQKIWYIANQIVSAQDNPDVRFCIIGFRDRGDLYVTDFNELTSDIDRIHEILTNYKAGGGGDTPESVNQALYEAVTKPNWRVGQKSLRIVYLVGDSPPQMKYKNDVPYYDSARIASKNGIFINTIQCGNNAVTKNIWEQISLAAKGDYSIIAQNANTTTINTPWDDQLSQLNRKLGKTIIPYGSQQKRRKMFAKQSVSESVTQSTTADRLAYNAKTDRVVQGDRDLLELIQLGKQTINSVEKKWLPANLQGKSAAQIKQYISEMQSKRVQIQKEIRVIIKKRDNYIAAKAKSLGSEFDQKIVRSLQKQAESSGIRYSR